MDSDSKGNMNKIASFTVDHVKLRPGIYVSRRDKVGDNVVTTFDLRMTTPNVEPVMDMGGIHAIEHLGATYLRNQRYADQVIYFGPMGCQTGFYLIMAGDLTSKQMVDRIKDMMAYIASYIGKVPGASKKECGNYLSLNLPMAKYYARRYLFDTLINIQDDRLEYPE